MVQDVTIGETKASDPFSSLQESQWFMAWQKKDQKESLPSTRKLDRSCHDIQRFDVGKIDCVE